MKKRIMKAMKGAFTSTAIYCPERKAMITTTYFEGEVFDEIEVDMTGVIAEIVKQIK